MSAQLLGFGCTGSRIYRPPALLPADTRDIPEPAYRKINYGYEVYNKTFTYKVEQNLDFARLFRGMAGRPREALNTNRFDQVADSAWFTNRNGRAPMPLEAIARGANAGPGPDTTRPWTITSAKAEGVTPGFNIRDARGDHYVIKFDPPGYSELVTGAEAVCTKIFHAAGYNVPENYVTVFDPTLLTVEDDVELTDEGGRIRMMTPADIEAILGKVHRLPDGRIRAMASKFIAGKPLGGFYYRGTRGDDPNDIVPHEHRRELRGLAVLCTWVRHYDTKAGNNLDMYVDEGGRRFIKHYLIDFGATMGSATYGPQSRHKGHEYDLDLTRFLLNWLSFGLHVRDWEKLSGIPFPSIGRFYASDFRPGTSKPNTPNPAFENCTDRDGYWGAQLVMSFSDEQLAAIIESAQYSDPAAKTYLLEILRRRRDMTGRYWFNRVAPLDRFRLVSDPSEKRMLEFDDLGIESGLWPDRNSRYRCSLALDGRTVVKNHDLGSRARVDLSRLGDLARSRERIGTGQWEIAIQVRRGGGRPWSSEVRVYLSHEEGAEGFSLLGIRR